MKSKIVIGKSMIGKSMIGIDISGDERRKFLRAMQRSSRVVQSAFKSSGDLCLIGTDVSTSDRRSLKAQLAGRGDWRVVWWDFNCCVHKLINPRVSLEETMVCFHGRHHWITLTWLGFVSKNKQVFQTLDRHGIRSGMRLLIERERASQRHDQF